MEMMKFALDVAVLDGAPVIDVADALEKAARAAHHDVLAVELRFRYGDEPGKAPAAGRKKRKYTRRARPVDPDVSHAATKEEQRWDIPAWSQTPSTPRDPKGL